ncbi:MAG: hypothetical protein IKU09_10760 [Firmicutes bacterium]|nr:hypothetical protein [Bacillota bacterium]
MKTLCLYYTRTGSTKAAMEKLAQVLDADLAEYTDGKDRSGVLGYIGACFVSAKRTRVAIKENVDLASYDRVIIGMPVWVEGPCAIGRAFISQYKESLKGEVYYAVTHMGKGTYEEKIKAMDQLLGRPSAGQISMQTKEHDYLKDIEEFAAKLNV